MSNKLNILITGASGFVGKKLVQEALSRGYSVVAACRNSEKLKMLDDENLKIIEFDIEDNLEGLEEKTKGIDIICHLAAFIPKDFENYELAEKCYRINSLGTLKLMEFGKLMKVKHFIYFSSGNAYEYSESPVTENAKIYPSEKATYYLSSKLIGELYVDHFNQIDLLNTTIFRLSSVYGFGMKETEFIYKTIENSRNSIITEIYNDDVYKTDFTYVDDVVKATCLCIENSNFGIYNIGSGENYSLGYVSKLIASILHKPEENVKIRPTIDNHKVMKGFSALDMTKTKKNIGLVPTTLRNGLLEMTKEIIGNYIED